MRKLNKTTLATLVVAFLLFSFQTFAQNNRTVTGTVTDQSARGVPGVTVTVKGSTTATQTDATGFYRITVPDNATLVFTSVGYGSVEMPVGSKTSLDATMVSA